MSVLPPRAFHHHHQYTEVSTWWQAKKAFSLLLLLSVTDCQEKLVASIVVATGSCNRQVDEEESVGYSESTRLYAMVARWFWTVSTALLNSLWKSNKCTHEFIDHDDDEVDIGFNRVVRWETASVLLMRLLQPSWAVSGVLASTLSNSTMKNSDDGSFEFGMLSHWYFWIFWILVSPRER